MKKLTLLIILFTFLSQQKLWAKNYEFTSDTVKPWKIQNNLNLTFGQSAYKYWAKGGENSLSGLANNKFVANYTKNKTKWENTIEFSYGIIQQGEKKVFKTEDKIELTSNFGYKASEYWYYSGLMNFKTQFAVGYPTVNDTIPSSYFMSPGYLITSLGMEYKRKFYSVLLSVLTGKTTFVMNNELSDAGAYGVEKGKKIKSGLGTYVRFILQKEVIKNIELNNKLELFSDYFNKPEKVDVNWEVFIKMKVNKYFSSSIFFNLIYDYDTKYVTKNESGKVISEEAKIQYKEMFGLGLNFVF